MFGSGIKGILDNSKKQKRAKDLYESTIPVKGTLGERYLTVHRGIPPLALANTNFRYHPSSRSLVTPIYDAREKLIGVQTISLDVDGNKAATGNTAKKVYENRETVEQFGRVAMVRKGTDLSKIFIAEGVETAASLLATIPPEYTVVAALGITEFPHTIPYICSNLLPGADIVWLADNDAGEEAPTKDFIKSRDEFVKQGFTLGEDLFIATPSVAGEDWNDVLKRVGTSGLKAEFGLAQLSMELDYDLADTPKLLDPPAYEIDEREIIEKSFAHAKVVRNHVLDLEHYWYKAEELKFLLNELSKITSELERLQTATITNASALVWNAPH